MLSPQLCVTRFGPSGLHIEIRAALVALAPGRAQITATAGADCSPGAACPQYLMVLTIDVTVAL
jgi:hypothetical protein